MPLYLSTPAANISSTWYVSLILGVVAAGKWWSRIWFSKLSLSSLTRWGILLSVATTEMRMAFW